MVNGKVWPNLNVKPQQYRFRLLNGSNERFYHIRLSNQQTFIRIGSDGGYLPRPAELTSLLLSPAERADILIDFSYLKPGTKIIMTNDAKTPFPNGISPDPQTDGQIMQFTVTNDWVISPKKLPPVLNVMPVLVPSKTRILPFYVISQSSKTLVLLLNGQRWSSPISELPQAYTTEDWVFPNFSKDAHPIHVHLIQFLLVSRQKFNAADYERDWLELNKDIPPGAPPYSVIPKELPVAPYLQGEPIPPTPSQSGWMDTVNMNPGEVTTIRIRFAPQDGNSFPFDPSKGPGYVWHCHMLEHEDNELMRPFKVIF
jgi:spore coat protein A, manganese oxidase